MYSLNIHADSVEDLKAKLIELAEAFGDLVARETTPVIDMMARIPEETNEIKPVLTQDQMAQLAEEAPKHELPPIPPIEEVRAALNTMKKTRGIDAVKALLKEYDANSVPELKPEQYLQIRDRALAEA